MPRTKIDRRIIKTKKAINNALLTLLSKKSLDEISITELTQLADINRKTFYLHYTCIHDVANEIDARLKNDFVAAVDYATDPDSGFAPSRMFEYFNRKVEKDVDFFRALCTPNTSLYFIRLLQPVLLNRLVPVYRSIYEAADEDDLRDSLVFVIAGCLSLYFGWIHTPGNTDLNKLNATALRLMEAALSTLE